MNRYRAGLHVAGNVLVACKRCNAEKRRDDSLKSLTLATSGWASFLSHTSERCPSTCRTCAYWKQVWPDPLRRAEQLSRNLQRIIAFRASFPEFTQLENNLMPSLPEILTRLYSGCQAFAANEIATLLESTQTDPKP
jgi:hypothetical protein